MAGIAAVGVYREIILLYYIIVVIEMPGVRWGLPVPINE